VSATIYYGPIASGKTAWAVGRVREAARGLRDSPYIIVASALQVQAFQRRLAQAGGAMGMRVGTLLGFCQECLTAAGAPPVVPRRGVLVRLIEAAASQVGLEQLGSLADKPGFWDAMRRLIAEAKAAGITAGTLLQAADAVGSPARMRDLAAVYQAYEDILREQGWLDNEDALRHARDVLQLGAVDVAARWPLVIVDGFDDLTPIQVDILRHLAARTELIVLLTDHPQAAREWYRRYARTRRNLEQALGVEARPLPSVSMDDDDAGKDQRDDLARLVKALTAPRKGAHDPAARVTDGVTLMACADRLSEVRAALRWLKARIVRDRLPIQRAALIARSLDGYRPFLGAVAREYGLPIRLVNGLPLAQSPVIRTLLDLLQTQCPLDDAPNQPSLERRQVLDAWRSPYLDWAATVDGGETEGAASGESDVAYLQQVARRYRVIRGFDQWEGAFRREQSRLEHDEADDEALGRLARLRGRWDRFLECMEPPPGRQPYHVWVSWLEDRIGADPQEPVHRGREREDSPESLGVVRRVRAAPDGGEADIAALQALKEVLRAMVQVEEVLALPAADYGTFVSQLGAAVRTATYQLPLSPGITHLLVLDAAQARGLSFDVAAVIGLAEGEFPTVIREDVFLPDADRRELRDRGLVLQPSTESYENELFLVALSRAKHRLLLTRPRLADNGAPWQPSPYWEELRELVAAEPIHVGEERLPEPSAAASPSEALALMRVESRDAATAWLEQELPEAAALVKQAVGRLRAQRYRRTSPDGDLTRVAATVADQFGPWHPISATRLEAYALCPYLFFAQHVLRLEAVEPVREGLDPAQLGSIYHRILAQAYGHPDVRDPADQDQVLAVLPEVLTSVLDEAPEVEGFRPTAWWRYTCEEIARHVQESVQALAEMGPYQPRWFEQRFGRGGFPALVLYRGEDQLTMSGIVDRIDVRPDGGIRVIDYKTASKNDYGKRALERGEKLQVALYALAARDAMGLGEPVDGFYWHVRQAEPSGLQLAKYGSGPQDALDTAVEHAWRIVDGIRAGAFAPSPPRGGCPDYCPAATYCWWYREGWGG